MCFESWNKLCARVFCFCWSGEHMHVGYLHVYDSFLGCCIEMIRIEIKKLASYYH
jgi:hypothetical protein